MSEDKDNQIQINGDKNIVIQDVRADKLVINVDGNIRTIEKDLSELVQLLRDKNATSFRFGMNDYDLSRINQDVFDYIAGEHAFNKFLTKNLILKLQTSVREINGFYNKVRDIEPWDEGIYSAAKQLVMKNFVGVVGIQLQKLMAIGMDESHDTKKIEDYIKHCVLTANIAIELICFALISKLHDAQAENYRSISEPQTTSLRYFFDMKFDRNLVSQCNFLIQLISTYKSSGMELPIPELESWYSDEKDVFVQHCEKLQNISSRLRSAARGQNISLVDCSEAEQTLTAILSSLIFLANYRMASITEINYDKPRLSAAHYLHNYRELGITSTTKIDLEHNPKKIDFSETSTNTDAVLLYKASDKYNKGINLFPFVIDLNALKLEGDVKICFYSSRNLLNEKCLEYLFLEQNTLEKILCETDCLSNDKINEALLDIENRKLFKLNTFYRLFIASRNTILGV